MLLLRLCKESCIFAIHAIVVNKIRTFLSLLGITIGIFAIISVFTVVDSIENNIRSSIESLGHNVIFIQKWPWSTGRNYEWWKYMNRPQPKLKELAEIRKRSNVLSAATFFVSLRKTIQSGSDNVENVDVVALSDDYEKIIPFEIAKGRYLTPQEIRTGKNIAVIGHNIAENLFLDAKVLGKTVKLMGRKVVIVGVFEKEGEDMFGNSMDNRMVLPVNFIRKMVDINSGRSRPVIIAKAKENIGMEELKYELKGILRSIRSIRPAEDDNFALNEISIASKGLDELFGVVSIAGWIIGGFSILVGGFGIANIMFVSVSERTKQIGIQKSLGAKNYFVLVQFLFEAIVLCIIGGLLGLLIVYAGTIIATKITDFEISLTTANIILGLSISSLIGLLSGLLPAYRASSFDPVEAMRH